MRRNPSHRRRRRRWSAVLFFLAGFDFKRLYQNNKEAWREKGIIYRELNKDVIRARKKAHIIKRHDYLNEYFLCDCGRYYMRQSRARHEKIRRS